MKKQLLILGISVIALGGFVLYTIPDTSQAKQTIQLQEQPVALPTPLQQTLEEYEAYINESLKLTGTPGAAIAIVKDSSIIYLKGFGVRDVETATPVDVHSVFRLGSVSKCFASTLAGILVQNKVLNWDDAVVKYLPDFALKSPEQTKKLTLRNVLSHTTGLPYHAYTNLIEEGRDLSEMLAELKTVDLIGTPGEVYSYQNVAYSIIDKVIQVATGESYETQMREHVFGPLHMANASVSYEAIQKNPDVAKPHLFRGREWRRIPISNTYYNTAPAGGVNASITDMAKWMVAMLGNKEDVISPATIDQLFEPEIRATAKNHNFNRWSRIKKSFYGLGWRVIDFQNDTLAYHGGYVNGYRSEVAIHPRDRIAICVLANAPSAFSDQAIPVFFKMYDKYNSPIEEIPAVAAR